uniref:Uncharacterized protein n=1 Tax=Mimivirus LCMiAC02 TaxID=2506609 RepID=A0A481Z0J7_9VIRU|nr:MAG: uncharacterized protein LCMiAC02_00420 [Mimivirus LCMiAC02]
MPIDPSFFVPIRPQNIYPSNIYGLPYTHDIVKLPIVNSYKIQNIGPRTDHGKMYRLYEDNLPTGGKIGTFNTYGERLNIHNYIRSVFVKHGDGEDIGIGNEGNSLLSHLKFMDLNPYNSDHNTDKITKNPYENMPYNMLIYKSCYPIRFDRVSHVTKCAKSSMSINIRIYGLTVGEYKVREEKNIKYDDYDSWREIAFYTYIREKILKPKVCPNFINMYAYFICENSGIDFNAIARIKGKKEPQSMYVAITDKDKNKNQNMINKLNPLHKHFGNRSINPTDILYNRNKIPINVNKFGIREYYDHTDKTKNMKLNTSAYSGKTLISLTEAPNYNLYGWTSKSYNTLGNISKMINNGYHESKVWFSVLFQLIAALYVLQIHRICFAEFDIEYNIYIKDINKHTNIIQYWKYIIDGVEYYIPNYGYLVLIDSNFKDLKSESDILTRDNKKYKIYGNIFSGKNMKNIKYDDDDLNKLCFSAFKNTINTDKFSNTFKDKKGTKPPEEVLKLINDIQTEIATDKNNDIGYYIQTYMGMFLNNRIGTHLTVTEAKNVRKDDHSEFRKGEIVVRALNYDTYQFVIYLKSNSDKTADIITRKDSNKKSVENPKPAESSLFHYLRNEKILQNYKPNEANLSDDDLLETYIINK